MLTVSQVAKLLDCSASLVRQIPETVLPVSRTRGGQRRYAECDVAAYKSSKTAVLSLNDNINGTKSLVLRIGSFCLESYCGMPYCEIRRVTGFNAKHGVINFESNVDADDGEDFGAVAESCGVFDVFADLMAHVSKVIVGEGGFGYVV